MDLTGENRILVKYGLKRLEQTKNPGYRALLAVNGLEGKKLTAYHIGFVIGPCINASGRLDTARRALQLLGAETKAEAEELAGDLKALNDSRKDLTVKGTQQAVQMIEETDLNRTGCWWSTFRTAMRVWRESLRGASGKNISGPVLY